MDNKTYTYNDLRNTAKRIIDVDFFGARDAGETVNSIMDKIENDPLTLFNYLLDVIDDYQS